MREVRIPQKSGKVTFWKVEARDGVDGGRVSVEEQEQKGRKLDQPEVT